MKYNENYKKELGEEGEEKARIFLSEILDFKLTKPDWLGIQNGKYYQFEIKMKAEPFKPPPFYGHGLDIYQRNRRLELQLKNNLKCIVLIFEKNSDNIYMQFLDELEKGEKYTTKTGKIIIYPIENFKKYYSNKEFI